MNDEITPNSLRHSPPARATRIPRGAVSGVAATLLTGFLASTAHADTVVQVPLPDLLDGRSVTTLTNGQLVTWTLPTDGGGLQNAFATIAVAAHQGAPVANALPDDGVFPADARHPEVVLHFSNDADPTSPQTHLVPPLGSFSFALPAATYSKVLLFFNGAAGGTTLTITLIYADGTGTATAMVPDYYADISPTDPVIFNLASNLAKWSATTQIAEANHHNITGVELSPMADKTLTGIQVDRAADGYLVFWGATAIATSDIAGGGTDGGIGGDGGAGGTSGVGGTAETGDATDVGGTAGTGGATDTGGATNGAGGSTETADAADAGASGMTSGSEGGAGTTMTANAGASQGSTQHSSSGGCRLSAAGNDTGSEERALWLALGAASVCGLNRRHRRAKLHR